MEGPHGELRARLANGLRGHNTHRVANVRQPAIAQVAPVALRADAVGRETLEHRANVDGPDAGHDHRVHRVVIQLAAHRDMLEAGHGSLEHTPNHAAAEGGVHLLAVVLGDPDAFDGAAVLRQHDHVLRDVDQAAGQIARLRGPQRRVGQSLAGAVAGDEILHHGQAVAEVAAHRNLHDAPRRIGHQAAHARELADLLELRLGRTRVRDGIDRAVRVEHFLHVLLDAVGNVRPDLHGLTIALVVRDETVAEVLFELRHADISLVQDLLALWRHHDIAHRDARADLGGASPGAGSPSSSRSS